MGTAGTGAGKTVMSGALAWYAIEKRDRRTLFLADTDELVNQAVKSLYKSTGIIPGVEKGSSRASKNARLVVGSIQTMSQPGRLAGWDPDHFGFIIADEAHLSMADSWQSVLKRFNQDGAGAWVLGVTATPERGDEKDLWTFYEHLADEIGLFELIDLGFLAPITVETVPITIDATRAAISATYDEDSDTMTEAIEPYWDAIIDAWIEKARGRPTLFFHTGIRASKRFTERLIARGISSRHVDGKSPDRAEVLDGFERGDFETLNNAMLLVKGYDCRPISCVCILRPTESRVAYQQMVGRGTRISPETGKTDLLLLDCLWQFSDKMKPIGPADLLTSSTKKASLYADQMRGKGAGRLNLGDVATEFEREKEQQFIRRLKENAAKRVPMRCDARELGILLNQPDLLDFEPLAAWERAPITDKQKEVLRSRGISYGSIKFAGEASRIIGLIEQRSKADLATAKQVGFLVALGLDPQIAASFTFEDAKASITAAIS
jgi:superfamily II DNA or RNA helicase